MVRVSVQREGEGREDDREDFYLATSHLLGAPDPTNGPDGRVPTALNARTVDDDGVQRRAHAGMADARER
eukprot:232740-Chlamydomonas_euryale.AAC.2